jgi:hypothetical protein
VPVLRGWGPCSALFKGERVNLSQLSSAKTQEIPRNADSGGFPFSGVSWGLAFCSGPNHLGRVIPKSAEPPALVIGPFKVTGTGGFLAPVPGTGKSAPPQDHVRSSPPIRGGTAGAHVEPFPCDRPVAGPSPSRPAGWPAWPPAKVDEHQAVATDRPRGDRRARAPGGRHRRSCGTSRASPTPQTESRSLDREADARAALGAGLDPPGRGAPVALPGTAAAGDGDDGTGRGAHAEASGLSP